MNMGRRSWYTIFDPTLRDTIVPHCVFWLITQKLFNLFIWTWEIKIDQMILNNFVSRNIYRSYPVFSQLTGLKPKVMKNVQILEKFQFHSVILTKL